MPRGQYERRTRPTTAAKPQSPITGATTAEAVSDGGTQVIEAAAPPRPEMRAAPRAEDPRARAARRVAELREHGGALEEGEDKFFIDSADVPEAWEYEWKRMTVLGKEDPAYQVSLARRGWEPVPASRHPHLMPAGWSRQTIERDGMVLMERPREISDEARLRDRKAAALQMRSKEEQLNQAPEGQFERSNKGNSLVNVKKSIEAIPIPE